MRGNSVMGERNVKITFDTEVIYRGMTKEEFLGGIKIALDKYFGTGAKIGVSEIPPTFSKSAELTEQKAMLAEHNSDWP